MSSGLVQRAALEGAGGSASQGAASTHSDSSWNDCFEAQIGAGGLVQRKAIGSAPASSEPSVPAGSGGTSLPGGVRGSLEQSTGADLGGVRVHTGSESASAASQLSARAFTTGQDIHFGAGQYSPDSAGGQRLIAHEVAHTIQQRGATVGPQAKLEVSAPGDALEREADAVADAHARGESAPALSSAGAASVQRDALTDFVTTSFETAGGDKLVAFLDKIDAGDKAGALAAWALVPSGARHYLKYPTVMRNIGKYPAGLPFDPIPPILRLLGPDSIALLSAADISIGKKDSYVLIILQDTANAAAWMTALQADLHQFLMFMVSLPDKTDITPAQVKNLAVFIDHMSGVWPKLVFERVYPKLNDTSYKSSLVTRAWTDADVKRLFKGLANNLPVAHVQTITKGFYLGVTSEGKPLGYGWYNSAGRIVMPAGGATATKPAYTGTGTGHGMSGGAGTTTGRNLNHYDSTLLHEIGHGVGAHTDGDEWAKKWGDWKKHSSDAWSKKLFDDSAAQAIADGLVSSGTLPRRNVVQPRDARKWLAMKIAGRSTPDIFTWNKGDFWGSMRKWTDAQVQTFITTHYGAQNLTKYFNRGLAPDDAYKVNADNVATDGRVYTYLTVWDDSHCSYKDTVYNNKISTYSLCSYGEWFAEQYTEYYRTNKVAGTLPGSVKTKFDQLDKMKWDGVRDELKDPGAADDSTPMKQYTEEERILEWAWW